MIRDDSFNWFSLSVYVYVFTLKHYQKTHNNRRNQLKLSSLDMIRDNASVFHNPYLHGLPLGPAATERIIARAGGHEAADNDDDAGDDAEANHGERDCLVEREAQLIFKQGWGKDT